MWKGWNHICDCFTLTKQNMHVHFVFRNSKFTLRFATILISHILETNQKSHALVTFCGVEYVSIIHLDSHMKRKHSGVYKCFDKCCKKSFTDATNRRTHYLFFHNNDQEVKECFKSFRLHDYIFWLTFFYGFQQIRSWNVFNAKKPSPGHISANTTTAKRNSRINHNCQDIILKYMWWYVWCAWIFLSIYFNIQYTPFYFKDLKLKIKLSSSLKINKHFKRGLKELNQTSEGVDNSNKAKFECFLCKSKHMSYSALCYHINKRHSNQKSKITFSCDLCGEEYFYKLTLDTHMGTNHTGPFKCFDENCRKSFAAKRKRKNHFLSFHNNDLEVSKVENFHNLFL